MPLTARIAHRLGRLAILILACWLLTLGLSWGIPSASRAAFRFEDPAAEYRTDPHSLALHSYHPDEPHVFMALNNMRPAELDFNPRYFLYPTFYIYAVGAALQLTSLAGITTIVPSKLLYFEQPDLVGTMYLVGRSTTALFGILALLACYLLGRALYGRAVGLLAALFLAVMPLFVVHSHFITVDIPVTLWITIALWLAHRALRDPARRRWAATGLAAGVATATKYYGGLVILALLAPGWLAWRGRRHAPAGPRPAPTASTLAALAMIPVGFLLGCPYALLDPARFLGGLYDIYDAQVSGQESYTLEYGHLPLPWLSHLYISLPQGMGVALLGLAIGGIVVAARRRTLADRVLLSFVLPFFALITVSFLRPMRYVLPLLPPLAILAARLVLDLSGRFGIQFGRRAAAIGVTLVTLVAIASPLATAIAYGRLMAGPDARDLAARWIHERAAPGDRIGLMATPSFRSVPLDDARFALRVLGLDRARYERERPDYIVLTELEFHDYRRARDRFGAEAALIDDLLAGRFEAGPYRYEVIRFARRPELFGVDRRAGYLIHDGLFISPDAFVLRRVVTPRRRPGA